MTRKNSFDFIRLMAAIMVIFSHSFVLSGHAEPRIGEGTIGSLAVWIFFILSGYLISKSWDQYPRFNVFFAKRILRIAPGLIVATLGVIVVTGIFFTSLPLLDFFTNQQTLTYLNNIFLYNQSGSLPGVFVNNAYPLATNGPIWTLAYEFTMYLAVALIGILHIYKKIPPIAIWVFLFIAVLLSTTIGKNIPTITIFYLDIKLLIVLALMFFSGVLMHKYEKNIKLNIWVGVGALAVFVVLTVIAPALTAIFAAVLLAYAIFAIGKHGLLSWTSKYGDFSYGLYIYAFPIQQMIASATQTSSTLKMFVSSLFLTLIVSAISWYFIESKALKWKEKINTKKYPIIQADEAW
jgi:peptidoglycan/LPS O-acetylase OafA/YrhL